KDVIMPKYEEKFEPLQRSEPLIIKEPVQHVQAEQTIEPKIVKAETKQPNSDEFANFFNKKQTFVNEEVAAKPVHVEEQIRPVTPVIKVEPVMKQEEVNYTEETANYETIEVVNTISKPKKEVKKKDANDLPDYIKYKADKEPEMGASMFVSSQKADEVHHIDVVYEYGRAYGNVIIDPEKDTEKYDVIRFLSGIEPSDIEIIREFDAENHLCEDLYIKYLPAKSYICVLKHFKQAAIRKIEFTEGTVYEQGKIFDLIIFKESEAGSREAEKEAIIAKKEAKQARKKVEDTLLDEMGPENIFKYRKGNGISLLSALKPESSYNVITLARFKPVEVKIKRVFTGKGKATNNIVITFTTSPEDRIMITDFYKKEKISALELRFENNQVWSSKMIMSMLQDEQERSEIEIKLKEIEKNKNIKKNDGQPRTFRFKKDTMLGTIKEAKENEDYYNAIAFPEGIQPKDVRADIITSIKGEKTENLEIGFVQNAERIIIQGYLKPGVNKIENFIFTNGMRWGNAEIQELLDKNLGLERTKRKMGEELGEQKNKVVEGQQAFIHVKSKPENITFTRELQDLVIGYDKDHTIKIKQWFNTAMYQPTKAIVCDNGAAIQRGDVALLINEMKNHCKAKGYDWEEALLSSKKEISKIILPYWKKD
ncbi:MAG: calcium-binding protein, partial [Erysipelotrichaceae bacterium]